MTKRRSGSKKSAAQTTPSSTQPAKMSRRLWLLLAGIVLFALFLRLTGIWRSEPINYHPDDWVIARPVLQLANEGSVGEMTHYKWSACGVIYPLGYTLHALKFVAGPYNYNTILVIQRVMSAVASALAVLAGFLLMRKITSLRAAFFAAALLAVAKLPVLQGHYGTVTSTVSLIIPLLMWLLYDLFDIDSPSSWKILRCCAVGVLLGWGIAAKWTIFLAALPISGAFFLSCWHNRGQLRWPTFIRMNIIHIVVILVVGAVSFIIAMPDMRHYPQKVREGFAYEMEHNRMGHLGEFTAENSSAPKRIIRTGQMLNRAGGPYLLVAGGLALIVCLARPTRPGVFLIYVMLLWLFVLYRNIVSSERHHLVPFAIMILLLAMALDSLWVNPRRLIAVATKTVFIFLLVSELFYACIAASPFWQPESRLECARWVQQNFPPGTGVAATPMTPTWTIPGTIVGGEPMVGYHELKGFSRRPAPGSDMIYLAAHRSLNVFKKHPPDRPVNPKEWFYGTPPSMEVLRLYAELNKEHSDYFTRLRVFFAQPRFLGLDLRFFGQPADKDTVYANRAVTVFRLNRPGANRR